MNFYLNSNQNLRRILSGGLLWPQLGSQNGAKMAKLGRKMKQQSVKNDMKRMIEKRKTARCPKRRSWSLRRREAPPPRAQGGRGRGRGKHKAGGVGGEVNLSLQDLSKTPKNAPRRLKSIKECPRMLRSQEKSKKFTSNYTKESQLMS